MKTSRILLIGGITAIVIECLFAGAVGYVAWHFVSKYW